MSDKNEIIQGAEDALEYLKGDKSKGNEITIPRSFTVDDLREAFVEGFRISGEGWNGEYPYEGHSFNYIKIETEKQWEEFLVQFVKRIDKR